MLLVIDAGNTNSVFAVFDGDDLLGQWRISANKKRTADEYAVTLISLMQSSKIDYKNIKNVIISSVVPQGLFELKSLSEKYFNTTALIIGRDKINLGIEVKTDRPSEVGADRLVNSVEAFAKFGGNVIVIDFGTATTFDVVGKDGEYLGGVIAPGINLSIEALRSAASKLPDIEIKKPETVIGKSTIPAMQSGVFWGYVGLIEGITKRIEEEHGSAMKVVATGGLARLFHNATDKIGHLEPDLTILGLKRIFYMQN